MSYQNPRIAETAELLKKRAAELENKADILRAIELKALFDEIKTLPPEERGAFGQGCDLLIGRQPCAGCGDGGPSIGVPSHDRDADHHAAGQDRCGASFRWR